MDVMMGAIAYNNEHNHVQWQGMVILDQNAFDEFMANEVASRFHDYEGTSVFDTCLRGLATTGFEHDNVSLILNAQTHEEQGWAIGEALAEAWLTRQCKIIWPWNMMRDKRHPKASLPGADLIGFCVESGSAQLVLGEVKSSGETRYPPQVMSGRSVSGMTYQLEKLATDLSLLSTILYWLRFRCQSDVYLCYYKSACLGLIQSGNKSFSLYGILIRDTPVNERDLGARGQALADMLEAPTTCNLLALHIPCKIDDLACKLKGVSIP